MKKPNTTRQKGKSGVELIEEATNLLRRASAGTLCCYYLGSMPFVFSILYFWTDMSSGTAAAARLAAESLWLALLFFWMKCWQAVFTQRLRARVMNEPTPPFSLARLVVVQGIIQPWSLIVMPLALLLALPFGWCFAFFQNATVLGHEGGDVRAVFRKARSQADLWPGQNIVVIFFIFLFAVFVFANLGMSAFLFPRLLKNLLGLETVFTRSNIYLLNSTFWISTAALAYLCVDPLLKAIYVMRCFYGESLKSGADLLTEMRAVRRATGPVLKMVLLCVAACAALAVHPAPVSAVADKPASDAVPVSVDARELDRSIGQVISSPEFSWRLPPDASGGTDHEIPGFIGTALEMLSDWGAHVGKWLGKLFGWLADHLSGDSRKEEPAGKSGGLPGHVHLLLYLLMAAVLCVGAVMVRRLALRKDKSGGVDQEPHIAVEPDMTNDDITAEELPGDRWVRLAYELIGRGEIRLGLRALYFACLAHLAEEKLLTIARFKSNRDYERELRRRAHSMPDLVRSFSCAVAVFERTWYGSHPPQQDMVDNFISNYRRITTGARAR